MFVCRAQVSCEEVGEGAAGEVEGCGVGRVGGVPGVVEGGEGRGGVLGAEEEVAFCFVGFEVCVGGVLVCFRRNGVGVGVGSRRSGMHTLCV